MIKKILAQLFILLITLTFAYADPGGKASKVRTFKWSANTESDLAGYKIYHEKKFLVDISNPLTTSFEYLVDGLHEGDNIFNLTAYDESGNESGFSKDVTFIYDSIAPLAPTDITILKQTPTSRIIVETWE